jgi:transcription initiation factor TFIID subunit 11
MLGTARSKGKNKEDEEEKDEDNMDVELPKLTSTVDPNKMAK